MRSVHLNQFPPCQLIWDQINIFPGANGAGKSNILEALGIVSAAVFGIDDDESLLRLGVRPGVLPRLYKTSNIHSERSVQISFSARSRQCEYRISLLNSQDTHARSGITRRKPLFQKIFLRLMPTT